MRYLLAGLLFLLVCYLLTGVTLVKPGERAVVRRFGRMLDHKPGPGLHIGFPWGIDRVDRIWVDGRRSISVGYTGQDDESAKVTLPAGQLLTGDQNLVNIQVTISYTVREEEVEDYVLHMDRVDDLLRRAAEALLAEWVAVRKVDDILLNGKAEVPAWLRDRTQERVRHYRLGIQIEQTSVVDLSPPHEVKADFERVKQAKTNKDRRLKEAEKEAEKELSAARSMAFDLNEQAKTAENEEQKRAKGDVYKFQERLAKNKDALQKDRNAVLGTIWQQEMKELFGALKTNGQLQLLDHFLTKEGLDLMVAPLPKKR